MGPTAQATLVNHYSGIIYSQFPLNKIKLKRWWAYTIHGSNFSNNGLPKWRSMVKQHKHNETKSLFMNKKVCTLVKERMPQNE